MEVPRKLYLRRDITDAELRVLGVLLSFVPWRNPSQVSFVSARELRHLCGKSKATVYRALGNLVTNGVLEKAQTDWGSPGFRLSRSLTTETICLTAETVLPTAETPSLADETVESHQRDSLHYRNHDLNHDLTEAKAPNAHTQLNIYGTPEPAEGASKGYPLEPLWASHQRLRKEALSELAKPNTTQGLTQHARKLLNRLLEQGFSEETLIAAWSQARNEAIKGGSMEWFNGSTELRPDNVTRLSGRFQGESTDEARDSSTQVKGGNKGWGVAMVNGTRLSSEERNRESEWKRRKEQADVIHEEKLFAQAQEILEPYGFRCWDDYAQESDRLNDEDRQKMDQLPDIAYVEPIHPREDPEYCD